MTLLKQSRNSKSLRPTREREVLVQESTGVLPRSVADQNVDCVEKQRLGWRFRPRHPEGDATIADAQEPGKLVIPADEIGGTVYHALLEALGEGAVVRQRRRANRSHYALAARCLPSR